MTPIPSRPIFSLNCKDVIALFVKLVKSAPSAHSAHSARSARTARTASNASTADTARNAHLNISNSHFFCAIHDAK